MRRKQSMDHTSGDEADNSSGLRTTTPCLHAQQMNEVRPPTDKLNDDKTTGNIPARRFSQRLQNIQLRKTVENQVLSQDVHAQDKNDGRQSKRKLDNDLPSDVVANRRVSQRLQQNRQGRTQEVEILPQNLPKIRQGRTQEVEMLPQNAYNPDYVPSMPSQLQPSSDYDSHSSEATSSNQKAATTTVPLDTLLKRGKDFLQRLSTATLSKSESKLFATLSPEQQVALQQLATKGFEKPDEDDIESSSDTTETSSVEEYGLEEDLDTARKAVYGNIGNRKMLSGLQTEEMHDFLHHIYGVGDICDELPDIDMSELPPASKPGAHKSNNTLKRSKKELSLALVKPKKYKEPAKKDYPKRFPHEKNLKKGGTFQERRRIFEMNHLQSHADEYLCSHATMEAIIKDIDRELFGQGAHRWTQEAIWVLQIATEKYLERVFQTASFMLRCFDCDTLTPPVYLLATYFLGDEKVSSLLRYRTFDLLGYNVSFPSTVANRAQYEAQGLQAAEYMYLGENNDRSHQSLGIEAKRKSPTKRRLIKLRDKVNSDEESNDTSTSSF